MLTSFAISAILLEENSMGEVLTGRDVFITRLFGLGNYAGNL
jgi:hypothetical protein